jgi:hypothetical protein
MPKVMASMAQDMQPMNVVMKYVTPVVIVLTSVMLTVTLCMPTLTACMYLGTVLSGVLHATVKLRRTAHRVQTSYIAPLEATSFVC